MVSASPPGGIYPLSVEVTLTCTDPDNDCQSIFYTLDDSAPTDDGGRHLRSPSNPVSLDMSVIAVFRTSQTDDGAFWNAPALIGAEVSGRTVDWALGLSSGQVHMKAQRGDGFGARSGTSSANALSGSAGQCGARRGISVLGLRRGLLSPTCGDCSRFRSQCATQPTAPTTKATICSSLHPHW
ncbi:MAG: chitobiase/beta-hexosaminidase C-terminal domain-containing protein [Gammaproteobacteria bacterium]